jgi:threonyl-tRNA synthetase
MKVEKMNLEILRHSCSHIMASAVKRLYPQAKLGIGPAIEDGFYYDFDIEGGIREEDLPKIEGVMKKIIAENHHFIHEEWDKKKAKKHFATHKEEYKLELIDEIDQELVSIYKHDDFIDLCKGPHVDSTGQLKHFRLLAVSGAYWRGDETQSQLTRIYGTVFFSQSELETYLQAREEAKKRDHRILGRALQLFDIYYNEAGAGLVFYLPKGAVLRRIIEDWEINEHIKRGYQTVITPHIMHKDLWKKSGHLEYYTEYMYPITRENQEFILKPMNCPGHILVYKSKLRSWRELPLRIFELGTVYRYEKSGVLHGLLRVRGFTQDDAHIFCKEEDLSGEIEGVLDFVKDVMKKFGFTEFEAELSTRPEKFIGDIKRWDLAEQILEDVLKKKDFNYTINVGDGAFYGPKIDIKLKDALKRSWQCATIQLDYSLPEKFDLTYVAPSGEKKSVAMIHRVVLGSVERFLATLVEHYAGRFPLWLAPVQMVIITITEDTVDYATSIRQRLEEQGFRVELDAREETLQRKIREKELEKIPYLLIVGRKEKEQGLISLREGGGVSKGQMTPDEFIAQIKKQEEFRRSDG